MCEKDLYNGCHFSCRFGCHFNSIRATFMFLNRLTQKLTQEGWSNTTQHIGKENFKISSDLLKRTVPDKPRCRFWKCITVERKKEE
jgi:hypothetical protein